MRSRCQCSGRLAVCSGRSRRLIVPQFCREVIRRAPPGDFPLLFFMVHSLVFSMKRSGNTIMDDLLFPSLLSRYDPKTNQWSSDVAPTSTCRTSVGVAVLGGYLYAVGGQDGVSCLNIVERCLSKPPHIVMFVVLDLKLN